MAMVHFKHTNTVCVLDAKAESNEMELAEWLFDKLIFMFVLS